MPAGRKRAGFCLPVADDAANQQLGIVEYRAMGVHERVAQLAALVDRAWRLGSYVTGDAPRKGELPKQAPQTLLVVADVRVDLAVGALEIGVGDQPRASMAGTGHEDDVQIARLDQTVQMRVDEVQAGGGAPVAEQTRLDVLDCERFPQQRVVQEVDLPDGEVIRRAPVRVERLALLV
jgi:hypothetical protein